MDEKEAIPVNFLNVVMTTYPKYECLALELWCMDKEIVKNCKYRGK